MQHEHAIPSLPAYLIDLNAIHVAEKTLEYPKNGEYCNILEWLCKRGPAEARCLNAMAPAHFRAEAFLRTIGKWEDSE